MNTDDTEAQALAKSIEQLTRWPSRLSKAPELLDDIEAEANEHLIKMDQQHEIPTAGDECLQRILNSINRWKAGI